jgi:hypothetical protein
MSLQPTQQSAGIVNESSYNGNGSIILIKLFMQWAVVLHHKAADVLQESGRAGPCKLWASYLSHEVEHDTATVCRLPAALSYGRLHIT